MVVATLAQVDPAERIGGGQDKTNGVASVLAQGLTGV